MFLASAFHTSLNSFLPLTNYSILNFFRGFCPGPSYSNFPFTVSLNFEIYFSSLAYLLSSRTIANCHRICYKFRSFDVLCGTMQNLCSSLAKSTSLMVGPEEAPPRWRAPPPGKPSGLPPGMSPALWYSLVLMGLQDFSSSLCWCSHSSLQCGCYQISW